MEEASMSYGGRGDRVSASRRRLNEARHRDGFFSPPSDGCTHRERCDRQSCSEDNSSGKEVEGAHPLLVASPPCDVADDFSDGTRPFVRRPRPPDDHDGGRGEDGRDINPALYGASKQHSAPDRGNVSRGNSSSSSSSIDNRDESGSSRCLLEEVGKRGSTSTSGSGDGVETHVALDGGDSEEKSLRLRVAGDFVGNVFRECSSGVAWSTSRPLK